MPKTIEKVLWVLALRLKFSRNRISKLVGLPNLKQNPNLSLTEDPADYHSMITQQITKRQLSGARLIQMLTIKEWAL